MDSACKKNTHTTFCQILTGGRFLRKESCRIAFSQRRRAQNSNSCRSSGLGVSLLDVLQGSVSEVGILESRPQWLRPCSNYWTTLLPWLTNPFLGSDNSRLFVLTCSLCLQVDFEVTIPGEGKDRIFKVSIKWMAIVSWRMLHEALVSGQIPVPLESVQALDVAMRHLASMR